MAPRLVNLTNMSDKALRSAFPRCKAEAISFLEAASLVTCRKRNMLSGLKEERRGIRSNHSGTEFYFQEDSSHFFRFSPELFSLCRDYIGRPTHDRLAALRQAGRTSPKGERGGGTTWPASSFYLNLLSITYPRDSSTRRRFVPME